MAGIRLAPCSDRALYEDLFTQAGHSTLVQSWAWGETKRETEGWVPLRVIAWQDDRPVAVAQILQKRLGGLVAVGRLNRGPVWLDPSLRRPILAALLGRWRWWRGRALFVAPEIETGDAALAGLGLRARKAPPWRSAWMDLSPPPEALRKGLDGKWRNMLVGGEKAGLEVTAGSDPALLDWLLDRHEEAMREKGFAGTPVAAIRGLARHAFRPDDLLVLRASAGGSPVGGVLLARHGAAATYLVGWNDADGRKLKANNLLLWRGLLELRERGAPWLDVGGIDPVLTPGVAAFKRGLKGREYELAGEFLSL